ncbi:MAG: hypothetical protein JSW54_02495 [Fidelibacterota bacterium]|nr:MAG: hypothetical protein JSW54_02495 [Candidatus Neomarinimicrobiota bacterium]
MNLRLLLMPIALLFATLGCQDPITPEASTIHESELAIVFTIAGVPALSDELSSHRLRIAFDGYTTYEELTTSGNANIIETTNLGMAGYSRLDSAFQAVNYTSLGIHSRAADSLYCVQNGFAFQRISYRSNPSATFHSLTDAICFQTPPASFTILRYRLLGIIDTLLAAE